MKKYQINPIENDIKEILGKDSIHSNNYSIIKSTSALKSEYKLLIRFKKNVVLSNHVLKDIIFILPMSCDMYIYTCDDVLRSPYGILIEIY